MLNKEMSKEMSSFRIAARGLIVVDSKLLLVSNEGEFWYLPGGGLDTSETLEECLEREVYEETGLVVKTDKLLHVLECHDLKYNKHIINFYFTANIVDGKLCPSWIDKDQSVQYRECFSLNEIENNPKILPRFLSNGTWLTQQADLNDLKGLNNLNSIYSIYQGCLTTRGFEVLNT